MMNLVYVAYKPILSMINLINDNSDNRADRYYVAYKPITLPCIWFMFNEIKFIHCHSCVMFVMNSMSICND